MIGDKRLDMPENNDKAIEILEEFCLLPCNSGDTKINLINVAEIVKLNNEVYEKMQVYKNAIDNIIKDMRKGRGYGR